MRVRDKHDNLPNRNLVPPAAAATTELPLLLSDELMRSRDEDGEDGRLLSKPLTHVKSRAALGTENQLIIPSAENVGHKHNKNNC